MTVVGGCGHVGLPLSLAFASRGLQVRIVDIDGRAVDLVNEGRMPFREEGAAEVLASVVGDRLEATTDRRAVGDSEHVVFVLGTPIDHHLDPDPGAVVDAVLEVSDHLRDSQLVMLRSTLLPGTTARVEAQLAASGRCVDVVYCPERIAEGRAMTELFELPQIVGARTSRAAERATKLFRELVDEVVVRSPEEAELAKLFANSYRYLKFAAANQFFQIANDHDLDYERIRSALVHRYPRAMDLPSAGFAAGPCLLKDTMQLAAFDHTDFLLGHGSMMINEGLPLYVVERMARRWTLADMRVGILGMAFKGESDDSRSSLSYKLRRFLRFRAKQVSCTDPYVSDPDLIPLEEVCAASDLLVIGAPHDRYATLDTDLPVVDIWGIRGGEVRV